MTSSSSDSERRISATFEGERIEAEAGISVAAALIATGRPAWRTTRGGKPRGLFCGIGVCFDCIVNIDGESGQRSCMVPLTEGMRITDAANLPDVVTNTDAANLPDVENDTDAAHLPTTEGGSDVAPGATAATEPEGGQR